MVVLHGVNSTPSPAAAQSILPSLPLSDVIPVVENLTSQLLSSHSTDVLNACSVTLRSRRRFNQQQSNTKPTVTRNRAPGVNRKTTFHFMQSELAQKRQIGLEIVRLNSYYTVEQRNLCLIPTDEESNKYHRETLIASIYCKYST